MTRNKIQFHSFLFKRPHILKQLVIAIRRADWEPTKTSKLCSAHFLKTDYQNRPGAYVKLLKPDAVLSIFNFPDHLRKKQVHRKTLFRKFYGRCRTFFEISPNGIR